MSLFRYVKAGDEWVVLNANDKEVERFMSEVDARAYCARHDYYGVADTGCICVGSYDPRCKAHQ